MGAAPYLVQACVIRLDANAFQDFLDVLGLWVFVAAQGSEEVSSNVTHPKTQAGLSRRLKNVI